MFLPEHRMQMRGGGRLEAVLHGASVPGSTHKLQTQLQTRRRVLTCLPFPNFGLLCSRSVGEACSFHPKMTSRSISGSARCRQTGCLSR